MQNTTKTKEVKLPSKNRMVNIYKEMKIYEKIMKEENDIFKFIEHAIDFFVSNKNPAKFKESLSINIKIKANTIKNLNIKNLTVVGFITSLNYTPYKILILDDIDLNEFPNTIQCTEEIIQGITKRKIGFNLIVSSEEAIKTNWCKCQIFRRYKKFTS